MPTTHHHAVRVTIGHMHIEKEIHLMTLAQRRLQGMRSHQLPEVIRPNGYLPGNL